MRFKAFLAREAFIDKDVVCKVFCCMDELFAFFWLDKSAAEKLK